MSTLLRGNSISFCMHPVEGALRRMAAVGYTGVEMWNDHLRGFRTPELLARLREFAASLGLEIVGLNAVGADYFQPFGSAESFEETLRGLKADIDLAVALGVRDVMVWEGVRPASGQATHGELLETASALFEAAIAYARPRGVRLLAEPHPFTLGMDLDFAVGLCDRLDPNHFGLLYDFCHFGVGRPDGYVEAVHVLGPRIRHLHFSDTDLRTSELHYPPGTGRMDVSAVVSALREIEYRGTITLDLYGYPLPEEGSSMGLPALCEAIERLGLA